MRIIKYYEEIMITRIQGSNNNQANKQTFGSLQVKWSSFKLLPVKNYAWEKESCPNSYNYRKQLKKWLRTSQSAIKKACKDIQVKLNVEKWNPTRTDSAYLNIRMLGLKKQPIDKNGQPIPIGKPFMAMKFKNAEHLQKAIIESIEEARNEFGGGWLESLKKKKEG